MGTFPRLRAGTFIEAAIFQWMADMTDNFPAFGRGLSLRLPLHPVTRR